jgi:ketosteroid isomerase-like protein
VTEAILKGDTKFLDRHTADDYMVIDSSGAVWDKKKNLEFLGSGNVKFESIKDSDVKVHFHGDAAVITGLADVKGKSKTHDLAGEYRWSRVYVQRDGRWQCVMEQLTRVFKEKK